MKKPKMVIIVRTDTPMTVGKMISQTGHAVAQLMLGDRNETFVNWLTTGMKKVTLQVGSEKELDEAIRRAQDKGLPVHVIRDAGLTQLEPGTKTCCAIGPATEQQMKKVTGSLKLYD